MVSILVTILGSIMKPELQFSHVNALISISSM